MKPTPFDPKELEVVETEIAPGMKTTDYNYPIDKGEGVRLAFQGHPWWQVMQGIGPRIFLPMCIPDVPARGMVAENYKFDANTMAGGPDMFGVEWEYVKTVGGSMVRPGEPYLDDISEWREKVVWPDVDSWPWEECAARNNGTYLKEGNLNQLWFYTSYFERLIAFLDFENAIMALFDEDSQEEVHAFFDKLTDLYINIFEHVMKYFPAVNAVFFHDDWGSQKETFFSPAIVEEMIVPYMKRLTDFLHAHGWVCEIHSCGNNYKQVPNYIKAGWDVWAPQLMNDVGKIYDDFGDKIIIAAFPNNIPEDVMKKPDDKARGAAFAALPEEEQRRIAREYCDRFCHPDKPTVYNFYAAHWLTPAFRDEMYKQSRINYAK